MEGLLTTLHLVIALIHGALSLNVCQHGYSKISRGLSKTYSPDLVERALWVGLHVAFELDLSNELGLDLVAVFQHCDELSN